MLYYMTLHYTTVHYIILITLHNARLDYIIVYYVTLYYTTVAEDDSGLGAGHLSGSCFSYGQFSKFYVCSCGLDPGNLKFETVGTNKQHICF